MRRWMILATGLLLGMAADGAAMRFWWFDITRDGKPAFSGGIGMSDDTPPREVLASAVRDGRLQPSRETVLTEQELSGDVTLEGEIVFSFPELEPVTLSRLRIVHDPEPRTPGKSGYFDWRLHSEDAKAIIGLYAPAAGSAPPPRAPGKERTSLPTPLIVAGVLVVLFLIVFVLRGRS